MDKALTIKKSYEAYQKNVIKNRKAGYVSDMLTAKQYENEYYAYKLEMEDKGKKATNIQRTLQNRSRLYDFKGLQYLTKYRIAKEQNLKDADLDSIKGIIVSKKDLAQTRAWSQDNELNRQEIFKALMDMSGDDWDVADEIYSGIFNIN